MLHQSISGLPLMLAPLPHAYPFLLIDRVVERRIGERASAVRRLSRDDPLLDGKGCLPSVLLAEVMAQCAGLALPEEAGARRASLARIDRFRARVAPAAAGGELRVAVRVVKIYGAAAKVRAVVRADGRRCAAGEVVLQWSAAGAPKA